CMGDVFMYTDRVGIQVRKGYKVQGHYGQFLGMMAQSRVPTNYPMRVDGKDYVLADLIETEKKTCVSRTELTFKLLGLSYYVSDSDETWTSSIGEKWNLQRLIREEIAAPIAHDAACGGTHRLMGMAYSVHRRKLEGKPLTGEFGRARKYLDDFHKYTFKLQNPDGSFSTEWFRSRGNSFDIERRLQTTGHILEWLVFSLPEEELHSEKVVAAVEYLTSILDANPERKWAIGPMGHALHGLMIYNQRVFAESDPVQQSAANPSPDADAPSKRF
ncbi:MAG TPA: GTPase-activating protein, partial [Pirellulales bacterium]